MNSENRKNIELAIKKLKENFKKNNGSNSWATNIVSASNHLEGATEWSHFYHFMADPINYNIDSVIIEEVAEMEEVDLEQDKRFETIVYENGNEAVIHLKRKEEEDEKREE